MCVGHENCFAHEVLPWIAGAWLIGLFIGAQCQAAAPPLCVAAALVGATLLVLHGGDLRARLWVGVLALLASANGLGVRQPVAVPCSADGEVAATAVVESIRYRQDDARVRLQLLEGRATDGNTRVLPRQRVDARVGLDLAPPVGSTVALRAELRPRTELRNPSPHPELMPPRHACWARFRRDQPFEVLQASSLQAGLHDLRRRVRRHMLDALPAQSAAVARALVLGDGAALGYERRKTIASVGLAHLFAVSGLHVALVSGTLVGVLRWLARGWAVGFDPRRVAAAFGVPLTLLHASFAGGSPSAWRAAITAAMTWMLVALGRRPSPTAITGAAALVLSAPNPSMALRPAFLLSIIATSAILSAPNVPIAHRWRRTRMAAVVSARTLVATTPMVWWWFGGVPLIGWLSNIAVLPFGTWVLIPLVHLFALTVWVPELTGPLEAGVTAATHVLLSVCDTLALMAWTKQLPPLDPVQGLIVLGGCVLLLVVQRWRRRLIVVVAAALLWLAAEHSLVAREQPREHLRVSFVDVGQGDATLIDFPDGRLGLIDTGQGGRHPASRELRDLLRARRRSRIDLLVITHGHPDHCGGLDALLEEVEVGEIWLNGQLLTEERDGSMERLLNTALQLGTRLRFAPELCEISHDFGGAEIAVLWPCPRYDPAFSLNDNSLTLRLRYGRRAFLFTGDLEADAERHLTASRLVEPADVLKVAHHGSRTSTTPAFLAAAQPSLALISSGAGNRYGHPSPTVLARLREARAEVLRTDLRGGVIVTTDGERLEVRR